MYSPDDHTPPVWAQRFLRWYCPDVLIEEIEGDLEESYLETLEVRGQFAANVGYMRDVLLFCNPTTFTKARGMRQNYTNNSNFLIMWHHYLKIALRNLTRRRTTSLTNILGLTVGFLSCILIALYVIDEFSFDLNHPHSDTTYRVYTEAGSGSRNGTWATSSPIVGQTLLADFPEVTESLRLYSVRQKFLFTKENESYLEPNGLFAEPAILNFFNIELISGDADDVLSKPNSLLLSKSMSEKYFGDQPAVGQTLEIAGKEATIDGVFNDISSNDHLQFNFLISFETLLTQVPEERMQSWVWQDFINYVKLTPNSNVDDLRDKLPSFTTQYADPQTSAMGYTYELGLQPLKEIHLKSAHMQSDIAKRGNYTYTIGLILVGIFLAAIACINFINLSTARAVHRFKEVGVRKAIGAFSSQLRFQFMTEALLIVGISASIAVLASYALLPVLNDFTNKDLALIIFARPMVFMAATGFVGMIGIMAGIYPAMVMSRFNPVHALTGIWSGNSGHVQVLRKLLVVVQFTLSILLITSVLFIFKQVNYLNSTNLGFDKTQLVFFQLRSNMHQQKEVVKHSFEALPGVESATICFGIPGSIVSGDNIIVPGPERKTLPARLFAVDHDYVKTMEMELAAGRDFSQEHVTDATAGFIINETAVKRLNLGASPEEAIGHALEWQMWTSTDTIKQGRVIGVVKDFHYASLKEEIGTVVMHIDPANAWMMAVRINSQDAPRVLGDIEGVWDSFKTNYPLDFKFVDESFGAMYSAEAKLVRLLWIFAGLAIFVACIGAFGLATYSAERRRSEISIRKVLGASTSNILHLLTRDFMLLVGVACLIAIPVSWYFVSQWLQSFAYSISISWWVFAIGAILTLSITLMTIGVQGLRAALASPSTVLRDS